MMVTTAFTMTDTKKLIVTPILKTKIKRTSTAIIIFIIISPKIIMIPIMMIIMGVITIISFQLLG